MYTRRVTTTAQQPVPFFDRDFTKATLGANAVFTRASTAYVDDYQGVLREIPNNIPRFFGARVNRNLLADTSFDIGAYWVDYGGYGTAVTQGFSDPFGGSNATRIVFPSSGAISGIRATLPASERDGSYATARVWLRAESAIQVRFAAGSTGTLAYINLDTTWRCYAVTGTWTSGTLNRALHLLVAPNTPGTIYAYQPLVEQARDANSVPGEFVAAGGFEYRTTANANTIGANNVLTEAVGARLSDISYLNERYSTNYFLNSFAPVTQSITQTGTHTVSCRGTGSVVLSGGLTGTVTEGSPITGDPGGTAVLCTCSGSLTYVQFEGLAYATSPISTTGSAVTRSGDILGYQLGAGNFPQYFDLIVDCTLLADAIPIGNPGLRVFGTDDSRGADNELRTYGAAAWNVQDLGGGAIFSMDYDEVLTGHRRFGYSIRPGYGRIFANGEIHKEVVFGTPSHSDLGDFYIGHWPGGTSIAARFRRARLYADELTPNVIVRMTSL